MSVSLSTHVLDTGAGKPAAGVRVELMHDGDLVGSGQTSPFFRRVELELALEDGHYHVPLLVSPFGCASYRGS